MESLSFSLVDDYNEAIGGDVATVEEGLMSYNDVHVGSSHYRKLAIIVKNQTNDVIGGLVGATLCGWLYVNTLWVTDEYRRRGIGTNLMLLAEEEARKRDCHHARLDTSEAQAPDFYSKLGYSVFGVLDDYPIGLKLYFLQKAL